MLSDLKGRDLKDRKYKLQDTGAPLVTLKLKEPKIQKRISELQVDSHSGYGLSFHFLSPKSVPLNLPNVQSTLPGATRHILCCIWQG
jgi:hypothetical protein